MHSHRRFGFEAGSASAAVLGLITLGCNGASHPASSHATPAAAPPIAEAKPAPVTEPISLIGCLQEGHGGTYILTTLNEPKHPDSSKPSVVASERLKAAEKAYRLSARETTDLSKLVGTRVRVEGTVSKPSELLARNAAGVESTGTAGHEAGTASAARKIEQDDLAKVDVSSVQKVAATCGSRARGKHHSKHG